jgi:hypothetical protein
MAQIDQPGPPPVVGRGRRYPCWTSHRPRTNQAERLAEEGLSSLHPAPRGRADNGRYRARSRALDARRRSTRPGMGPVGNVMSARFRVATLAALRRLQMRTGRPRVHGQPQPQISVHALTSPAGKPGFFYFFFFFFFFLRIQGPCNGLSDMRARPRPTLLRGPAAPDGLRPGSGGALSAARGTLPRGASPTPEGNGGHDRKYPRHLADLRGGTGPTPEEAARGSAGRGRTGTIERHGHLFSPSRDEAGPRSVVGLPRPTNVP